MSTTLQTKQTYTIQGREVVLPLEVRDATAAVAYYWGSARAAQRLIDHTGLRIAQVLPGRTLCSIGAIVYRDNDLGPYNEIAVTFFVRGRNERSLPIAGTAIGLARGTLGSYIHQLPVNGEFTCEAGQQIWGFPKFVTEINVSEANGKQTAVLRSDGRHVLTHRVRAGGGRAFQGRRQVSYAYRNGTLYRTPSTMSGEGVGARLGGATLELGDHPLADELRSLGLSKGALFSTYITKMSGTFSAASVVA
jgi:hypothetical protein